ncbi:MAG TPA: PEP-CTERM sorting domain-containing protein [Pontiella sp.]|nr:PEP-CTERM sorting domain-containing protein [Pontiella sp.]
MKTNRITHGVVILAVASVVFAAGRASAGVIYEDIFYWMPDGTTLINPTEGPTDAWVKIQETVYDDAQGKQLLSQQIQLGLIHGSAVPAGPINVYAYSISNLEYDNGPYTGMGLGISGFNIVNAAGVPVLGQWGPNAANSWWEVGPNNSGPGNIEWDIDANMNSDDGDGIGILLGQTHNSFYYAVPDGTAHGITGGHWVHSWDTSAGPELSSGAIQTDVVYGMLSLPIPEPGTTSLVAAAAAGLVFVRRRLNA